MWEELGFSHLWSSFPPGHTDMQRQAVFHREDPHNPHGKDGCGELEVWATSALMVERKFLVKSLDYACRHFLVLAE